MLGYDKQATSQKSPEGADIDLLEKYNALV